MANRKEPGSKYTFISNVNSLAALCDRLSIENHKTAYFENKKRDAQKSENPDYKLIAKWDDMSRDACELRALIKKEIDDLFQLVVSLGSYDYAREVRTFSSTPRASQVLDDIYSSCAIKAINGELAEAFERELSDNPKN